MWQFSLSLFLLSFCLSTLLFTTIFASDKFEIPPIHITQNPTSTPCCLGNVTDDFSDGNLAPFWVDGSGCGSVYESGGQLVMDYPSSCAFYPSDNYFYLNTAYQLCGDFDIQLDFNLVSWPVPSGWEFCTFFVSNVDFSDWFAIERLQVNSAGGCVPYIDSYKSWRTTPDNCVSTFVSTSVTQGKFRIARTGSSLSAYCWDGSNWILVRTETYHTGSMTMGMTNGTGTGGAHLTKIDNIVIQSQPPSDIDLDTVPDCRDNCPTVANALQEDVDGDTVGDSCDICPTVFNPLQQNLKPGDANGDGSVTLPDIIYLVNHVFKGGPKPNPTCRGDANADTMITLPDIIYEVNHVFKGGPKPIKSGVCCV